MLHYSRNVVFVTLQSLFIMALSNFTVFLIFDHCELLAIFQIRARLCVVHGQTVWSSMYVKGQFFLPSIYNAPKSLGGGCLWNLLEHFSKMSIESTLRTSWWLSSKLGLMCLLLEKKLKKENDPYRYRDLVCLFEDYFSSRLGCSFSDFTSRNNNWKDKKKWQKMLNT